MFVFEQEPHEEDYRHKESGNDCPEGEGVVFLMGIVAEQEGRRGKGYGKPFDMLGNG